MRQLLQSSVNILPLNLRTRIRSIPIIASVQQWIVRRFLSDQPFVHTINAGPAKGLRFEVDLPRDKAIWAGTFESDFSGALRSSVHAGDVYYDIGGYRGYLAGVAALAGASCVVVFEPLPENIAALNRLAELNPTFPLQIQESAVGQCDDEVTFKVMSDFSMGKLADSQLQPDAVALREIQVPIRKLDTFVFQQELPPPDVMKIDVEGAEVDVLCGAAETLRRFGPKLFIEAHSQILEDACGRLLTEAGYDLQQVQVDAGLGYPRHLIATCKACRA